MLQRFASIATVLTVAWIIAVFFASEIPALLTFPIAWMVLWIGYEWQG